MDEFKKQLSTSVPLLASVIIQLGADLTEIEHEIELCRARIASGKLLLKSDRVVRDHLAQSPFEFDQYTSRLSVTIRAADEISSEFAEFERDILDFKRYKLAEISQMVEERMAIHQSIIDRLPALLEEVGLRLKAHAEETDRCSAKRDRVERSIPLLEVELNERRQLCGDLTERYAQLSAVLAEQRRTLDEERTEWTRKEEAYQKGQQKHVVLRAKHKTQNSKLTETKCQIRRSIFEYLNKVQRLNSLTETKNRKVDEFKSLFQKYSKEGLARLNERRANLRADLDRLPGDSLEIDRSESKCEAKSPIDQDLLADEYFGLIERLRSKQKEKNQVILSDLIDKLTRLESLYDRLIGAHETGGGAKDGTRRETERTTESATELTAQQVTRPEIQHVTPSASPPPPKTDSRSKKLPQPAVSLKSKLRSYKRK